MTDDRDSTKSGGGFDDWLDDEPGPVTDPYKVLASEDSEEEIADWMEYSQGSGVKEPAPISDDGPSESDTDETAEIEVADIDGAGDGDETHELDEIDEDTGEIEIVETPVDESQDDDPTDELGPTPQEESAEVLATDESDSTDDESPEVIAAEAVDVDEVGSDSEAAGWDSEEDDTDELEPVPPIGFGELWDVSDEGSEEPSAESASAEPISEPFDISQQDYLQTATKEHAGLAESIAAADDEDTEQVALAAPIPGLDSTVVGFEDVVEAEGHGKVRAKASGDLIARVITAIVLIVAVGASMWWRPALVALALVVFVLGAGEFYTALARSGRKPIALFGFLGIIGASLGAFFGSTLWIPMAFVFAAALLLLFYAVVPGKQDPLSNLSLTITVMVWAGLGAFAMPIIASQYYRVLVFGVVAAAALMDIAQYFFGRALGRHQLAPWVSPKKTIEGLVAGVVVALIVGALLHFLEPFKLTSGLAIGAAAAVLVPLGDLAMSAAKRSLGLKDMGSVLPGHGGFLDRIDGLLFLIPFAWAIFLWAGIL